MNIVFAGTPAFAATILESLLAQGIAVTHVYTQADRPAGRGQKLSISAVKQVAIAHGIPIAQPISLRDHTEQQLLAELKPDLLIVVAYGMLLPQAVLAIPRLGCINVHPSLLPRWRGAAPLQHALLAGDKTTGVTIMQMNERLDAGDLLLQENWPITSQTTLGSLHDELATLGARMLLTAIEQLKNGTATFTPQNDKLANYAPKLTRATAQINWQQSARQIDCQIRALNPQPGAFTTIGDQLVKIWQAHLKTDINIIAIPGTIIAASAQGIHVMTGEGVLCIETLQLAGGKSLSAQQILNAKQALFAPSQLFV